MKVLDLEHLEAQFGLVILDRVIEYYSSFKNEFKENSKTNNKKENSK